MMRLKPENVSPARYTAVMGILFSAVSALNTLESAFSAVLPAGIRVGLSNIVIMAAILCLNLPSALVLVILKAVLVLLTRGVTAGAMSFCGSLAAFAVTAFLFRKTKASYVLISVLGAFAHSFGQLAAAWGILGTVSVFAYAPVLAVASVITGFCTGVVLEAVFPHIKRIIPDISQK